MHSFIKNYVGILNNLLCRTQEDNKKYLFVVDSIDLSIEISKLGYSSISLSNNEDVDIITDVIRSANMSANNVITIGCCTSAVNEALKGAVDDTRYINGYKIYGNKKEYFQLHPTEIKPNIE